MSEEIWSTFELIVLYDICISLQQETDDSKIAKVYNDTVHFFILSGSFTI